MKASEARNLTRTSEEVGELWQIHKAIQKAVEQHKRFVIVKAFSSSFISDIPIKDYGYDIKYTGRDAMGQERLIEW